MRGRRRQESSEVLASFPLLHSGHPRASVALCSSDHLPAHHLTNCIGSSPVVQVLALTGIISQAVAC